MLNYTEFLRRWNITEEDLYVLYNYNNVWSNGTNVTSINSNDIITVNESSGVDDNSFDLSLRCYCNYIYYSNNNTIGPTTIVGNNNNAFYYHCNGFVRRISTTYRSYHGYVALLVCSFGTLANLLNVAVLTRKKLRRAPINRILTGLAAADVLVMLEYVPFAVYEYLILPKRRLFPYGWAVFILFHMHFSQLLHTISIALTLILAIYRYIVVR